MQAFPSNFAIGGDLLESWAQDTLHHIWPQSPTLNFLLASYSQAFKPLLLESEVTQVLFPSAVGLATVSLLCLTVKSHGRPDAL